MSPPSPRGRLRFQDDAFELEAETLRAMAHPKRLMILAVLKDQGSSVTEIANAVGLSLPNTSQNLRILRNRGIVSARRSGQNVHYRVSSPVIQKCCALVRQAIIEQAQERDRQLEAVTDHARASPRGRMEMVPA